MAALRSRPHNWSCWPMGGNVRLDDIENSFVPAPCHVEDQEIVHLRRSQPQYSKQRCRGGTCRRDSNQHPSGHSHAAYGGDSAECEETVDRTDVHVNVRLSNGRAARAPVVCWWCSGRWRWRRVRCDVLSHRPCTCAELQRVCTHWTACTAVIAAQSDAVRAPHCARVLCTSVPQTLKTAQRSFACG